MIRSTILGALVLLLAAPAFAQQQSTDGPLDPSVTGRNDELNHDFQQLNASVAPHVAHLFRDGDATGYGAVIDGGFILTAATVVEQPGSYEAHIGNLSTPVVADVVGRNAANDIALLKIRGQSPAGGIPLGSDAQLAIGQFVVTVGTGPLPLAVGVVSAKNREVQPSQLGKNLLMGMFSDGNNGHTRHFPSVLHHDGPVTPEDFGSPVVDRQGKLVGINVAAPFRGSSHAVGIDQIKTFLNQLETGAPERSPVQARPRTGDNAPQAPKSDGDRAWLGLSVVPAPAEKLYGVYGFGLQVTQVEADGPAAKAGVQQNDVLVTLDGKVFDSADTFAGTLGKLKPGDVIRVGIIREGKLSELQVTLGTH